MDWFNILGWISFIGMIAIPLGLAFLGAETSANTQKQHEALRARGIDPKAPNSNRFLATRDPRGADMGGIE